VRRSPPWLMVWIAVVASVVAGVALWFAIPHGPNGPPACEESLDGCGPVVAFNAPRVSNVSGDWTYNFSLEEAGGGLSLDNLAFEVLNAAGSPLVYGASWTLDAFDLVGEQIGTYDWATDGWTLGGSTPLSSGEALAFGSGSVSLAGVGDSLVVTGVGSYHGSTEVWIP
jgi:hypothetical protein